MSDQIGSVKLSGPGQRGCLLRIVPGNLTP
jgi:hypothetical protein